MIRSAHLADGTVLAEGESLDLETVYAELQSRPDLTPDAVAQVYVVGMDGKRWRPFRGDNVGLSVSDGVSRF